MLMQDVNNRETMSGERMVDGNSTVHSISDALIFTGLCSSAILLKGAQESGRVTLSSSESPHAGGTSQRQVCKPQTGANFPAVDFRTSVPPVCTASPFCKPDTVEGELRTVGRACPMWPQLAHVALWGKL